MSERPHASVLIATYNERPDFLECALGSILSQTFEDFEVVLVDDGSDDARTIATLDRLAAQDARVRLLREGRRGLTGSLNFGLQQCRGDVILRHDSDDWSEPDRFERQIAFLTANPDVALLGTGITLHREDGRPLWSVTATTGHDAIAAAFDSGNPFYHGSVAVRRDCLLGQGGYRPEFRVSQDYDCFWRLAGHHRVENLPEPLYHHRVTRGAISSSLGKDGGQVFFSILAQELGKQRRSGGEDMARAEAAARARFAKLDLHTEGLLRTGDRSLLAGHTGAALKSFVQAVLHAPGCARNWLKLFRGLAFVVATTTTRARLFGH